MKTDSLFYRFFQLYPGLLFELLDLSPDLAQKYQFSSVEIKQLAFRLDGLFTPIQAGDPLYFVEVQFQKDDRFYARLFAEIFLYLSRHRSPGGWRAVVVFPDPSVDSSPVEDYQELLNSGRVQQIYLDQLAGSGFGTRVMQFIVAPEAEAKIQVGSLVEQSQQQFTDLQLREQILNFLETMVVYKFPGLSPEEIARMFSTQDLKQTRFYQEVVQEGIQIGEQRGIQLGKQEGIQIGEQRGIQIGEQRGIQLGKQEGIQLGKQEGIQLGEAELTIRLLRRKLGALSDEQAQRIRALPVEKLEALGEDLLDFTTEGDLIHWLQEHS